MKTAIFAMLYWLSLYPILYAVSDKIGPYVAITAASICGMLYIPIHNYLVGEKK